MKLFKLFLCALVGMTCGMIFAIAVKAEDKMVEMMNPSVRVVTPSGGGSGTAIWSDPVLGTYITSNMHVVSGRIDDVTVQFYGDEKFYPAYVHSYDKDLDIVVLITRRKTQFLAYLGATPALFDEAFCVGSPIGMPIAPSKGIITGIDHLTGRGNLTHRSDCGIAPGNSGGGMYTLQRNVWALVGMPQLVGVLSMGFSTNIIPFLGMAVRVEDIKAHLTKNGVGYKVLPFLAIPVVSAGPR